LLVIDIGWGPNIVTIGGFLLTWHGLFTALGILAGVNLSLRMAQVIHYDPDDAYTLALVGVPSGIVGARLLYVIERWDFYGDNLGNIFAITEGGISIWGAILGGIAGAYLFALVRGYAITGALDIAAFGIIIGQAVGRVGDVVNGEHLAIATGLPWGVIYTSAESPGFRQSFTLGATHPAVAYELIGDLAILGVLFAVFFTIFKHRPGLTFLTYFVGYAVMRFFLTELRVDSAESLFGLRVPQVISLGVLLICVPLIAYYATQPPVQRIAEAEAPEAQTPSSRRVPIRRR
jgi:prolipoprotein diacylglyceryl transferase